MAMHGDTVTMHLIHSNGLNRRDTYWILELLQQFSISSSSTDVSRRRWHICGAEFPIQDWRGRVGFSRTHNWLICDVTLLVGGMWKNSPGCIICWLIEPLNLIYYIWCQTSRRTPLRRQAVQCRRLPNAVSRVHPPKQSRISEDDESGALLSCTQYHVC